jgi:hypothetical protein
MPAGLRIFAAVAEGLAGVGLVLPAPVHVLVWLTPLAAAGLVLLMLGAIVFHVRRREYPNIGLNAVLGILACGAHKFVRTLGRPVPTLLDS